MIGSQVTLSKLLSALKCHFTNRVELFRGGQLKSSLAAWSSLTSDQEILSIVTGDKITFLTDPPPARGYTRGIKLNSHLRHLLDIEVKRLLAKQIIVFYAPEQGEFISPIFPVSNSDGSLRLILNLKCLNEHIEFLHFKMDSIHTVLHNVTTGCYMASIDLKSAYYSVPIAPDFQKYLKFEWEGQLYKFVCYPNGLGPCPRKFTKLTKVPLSELRKEGSVISGFIDDFYLQGHDYDACQSTVLKSLLLFEKLGFVIHPEKSVFIPSQQIVYLGFVIDSVNMTVSVTPEKKEKLTTFLRECLHATSLPIRTVACLIGKLIACLPASRFGALYYRHLEREKILALKLARGNFDSLMEISQSGKDDIKWWLGHLDDMYAPIHLPQITKTISCDASNLGWGAVLDNTPTGGAWTSDEQCLHINCKEMLAIYYALRSYCDSIKCLHLRVLSDNSTAVSVLNKMGTVRSPQCNFIAKLIWNFCREWGIWITCAHIPGVCNVEPDFESRKQYKQAEWKLNPDVFLKAQRVFDFYPDLDCFASRINTQLPNYASFRPDPYAKYINSFSINWAHHKCYLFPPFSLIGLVLQKIRVDHVTALCVLPHWPTQTWWPLMKAMLVDHMWILKPRKTNLLLPQNLHELHPLHKKLSLVLCLLSGDTTKNKVFNQELLMSL